MYEIILSICIPTYNGGIRLEKLVRQILGSDRNDIEVAVTDNCSCDDTVERLKKINDMRLCVYENTINTGALENGIHALENANGKYAMLLLDRDIVQMKCLDEYVRFLKENEYGVLINLCKTFGYRAAKKIEKEELYYYLAKSPHPSFFTFHRAMLREIEITKSVKTDGYYPALIGMAISQIGGAYLNTAIPISIEAETHYILMSRSKSWSIAHDDAKERFKPLGYDPRSQKERLKKYFHYIETICGEKEILYAQKGIYQALLENTMNYIHELESTSGRHRYPLDDLGYTLYEHVQIVDDFYDFYLSCAGDREKALNQDYIETITQLIRLQFINETIPQLQGSYDQNCVEIETLRERLSDLGVVYEENIRRDMIFKEGAGVEDA